jgi:hypothetical protein
MGFRPIHPIKTMPKRRAAPNLRNGLNRKALRFVKQITDKYGFQKKRPNCLELFSDPTDLPKYRGQLGSEMV